MTEPDVSALRAEIARTRANLGNTVEALAGKADVKARASKAVDEAVGEARQKMHGAVDQVVYQVGKGRETLLDSPGKAALVAGVTVGAVALLVAWLLRGRRS